MIEIGAGLQHGFCFGRNSCLRTFLGIRIVRDNVTEVGCVSIHQIIVVRILLMGIPCQFKRFFELSDLCQFIDSVI